MQNLLNKNLPIDSSAVKYIKEFLSNAEIKNLLENRENFSKIYELLNKKLQHSRGYLVGCFTILFYNIGIDPLLYIEDIPENFLSGVGEITQIKIPKYIHTIGASAFADCSNLDKVTFNSKLVRIESLAFLRTALINVIIPEGVEYLDATAFSGCNKLEYISIPSTLKDIGDCALSLGGKGSNLKTIEYAGDKESFKNIFNGGFLTFKTTIVCNDGKLKYSRSKYEWVDIK